MGHIGMAAYTHKKDDFVMMRSRLFLICMVLSEGTFIPFLCMNPELNFGEGEVLSQQVTCGNQEQGKPL